MPNNATLFSILLCERTFILTFQNFVRISRFNEIGVKSSYAPTPPGTQYYHAKGSSHSFLSILGRLAPIFTHIHTHTHTYTHMHTRTNTHTYTHEHTHTHTHTYIYTHTHTHTHMF